MLEGLWTPAQPVCSPSTPFVPALVGQAWTCPPWIFPKFFPGGSRRNPPQQGGAGFFWEVSVTLPTKLFSLSLGGAGLPHERLPGGPLPAQGAASSALEPALPAPAPSVLARGSQGAQCCHRAPHPASRAHGSALLALRQGPWGEPGGQAWCWHLCPGGSSGLRSPAGPGLTAGGAGRESCPQRRPLLQSPPPGP